MQVVTRPYRACIVYDAKDDMEAREIASRLAQGQPNSEVEKVEKQSFYWSDLDR